MSIQARITSGPLGPAEPIPFTGGGAVVAFEGIVRPTENGTPIDGLMYESYEPMARQQIERICTDLLARHDLLAVQVEHSIGWVPVGRISFRLQIAAKHRQEAIAAMQQFIDLLKKDVPIWKSAR